MKVVPFIVAAFLATPALADLKSGDLAWQNGDSLMAIEEWRPLAIAGDPEAQIRLGQAYQLGRGVPLDLKLAEDWIRRAAQGGNAEARDNYGLILFQNNKRAEGLPYVEEAAGRGNPRAQYILGIALYNGDMIAKDLPRAYAMMLRASAAGIPAAANALTEMDKLIPLPERNRGKALAGAFATHASAQAPAPIPTAPPRPTIVQYPSTVIPKPAPRPTPAPAPATAPAPGGKWRVQLAAMTDGAPTNTAKANALWTTLHNRIAALAPYRPTVVNVGPITRLQAGPLISSAAANQLCASLRTVKQACLPVAP